MSIGPQGTIYVAVDGDLLAIDPDGSEKWRFTTGTTHGTSPAIGADGTIYAHGARGEYGQDSRLDAINSDGTLKWSFSPGGIPTIAKDGTIYFGSSADSSVHAIDPSGDPVWEFPLGTEQFTVPTIGLDSTVYVGGGEGDHHLNAFTPDGSLKWRWSPSEDRYVEWTAMVTPPIGPEGHIFAPVPNALHKLTPDKERVWYVDEGGSNNMVVGSDGSVYVLPGPGGIQALFVDGTKNWFHEDGEIGNIALGSEGRLYAVSDSTGEGRPAYLKAVDPRDGTTIWTQRLGDAGVTSGLGGAGPIIGTDRTIYVATDSALVAVGDAATTATPRSLHEIPSDFLLGANYPNPFNPATIIPYALPEASNVRLEVFDLLGRRIRVIEQGAKPAGRHEMQFRAGGLPSGTYVYRLTAGDAVIERVMTLAK